VAIKKDQEKKDHSSNLQSTLDNSVVTTSESPVTHKPIYKTPDHQNITRRKPLPKTQEHEVLSDPESVFESQGDTDLDISSHSLPNITVSESSQICELKSQVSSLTTQLASANEEVDNLNTQVVELRRALEDQQKKTEIYKKILTDKVPLRRLTPLKKDLLQIKRSEMLDSDDDTPIISPACSQHEGTPLEKETEEQPFVFPVIATACSDAREENPNITTSSITEVNVNEEITETNTSTSISSGWKKGPGSIMQLKTQKKPGSISKINQSTPTNQGEPQKSQKNKQYSDRTNGQTELNAKNKPNSLLKVNKSPSNEKNEEQKKVVILSTNNKNKIYQISRKILPNELQICHYSLPNAGIKGMLHDIHVKTKALTPSDYCVVLIGQDDFECTKDHLDLIHYIREILQPLQHTNFILCAPTYKCDKNSSIYNGRIETFNNLLCLDIETHQHAYLIDSNRDLTYDRNMFNMKTGEIKNHGIRQIINAINKTMEYVECLNGNEHSITNDPEGSNEDIPLSGSKKYHFFR
jgi:transcription termination factor NusB